MSPLCVEALNEQVVLHLTISLGGYLLNLLGRTRTTTQDLLLSLLDSQGVGLLPDISFFLHRVCRSELKSLLFMCVALWRDFPVCSLSPGDSSYLLHSTVFSSPLPWVVVT